MKRLVPKRLRAFPQIAEHNWLIHDCMLDFLGDVAVHARGILVDIGCANKPWRSLFADRVSAHLGVDLADSLHGTQAVDIIGSAYATGLPDRHANTVLCTEVLEHLERPAEAVAEMYRILSPGGVVILTVPFFWPVHEAPRDFYRYTNFGLAHLFEGGGFEIIEIRPLTGFIVTFGQLLVYYNLRLARGRVLRTLVRPVNWATQHVAHALNRFDKSTDFSCLYGLVARKPGVRG
jgi:SAM-dependent methyltransferase